MTALAAPARGRAGNAAWSDPLVGASIFLLPAAALALSPAPVWLRSLLALPVLVLVPGLALARLALPDPAADGAGPLPLRWLLAPVLGLLVMLADALLLNAFGVSLSASAIVLGDVALTELLLVGDRARRPLAAAAAPVPASAARLSRLPRRQIVGGVVAVSILVAALVGARLMAPRTAVPYGQLAFAGAAAGGEVTATAGRRVTLYWDLRAYGGAAVAAVPTAVVEITGASTGATVTATVSTTALATVSPTERGGVTAFGAPTASGRYRVTLRVAGAGTPLTLSTFLVVSR